MGFATSWLDKKALFPEFINEPPDNQTGIIVIIPAYNEPGISGLLDSLIRCYEPGCKVEIIVIVNAPAIAKPETRLNNKTCIRNIESWKKENKSFFRLFYFDACQPSIKGWGVGLARKTGMDEALRRFDRIGKPEGVIASLDADCTVGRNYFAALYSELYRNKHNKACSIYFEHPLAGNDFSQDIYDFIL
ncbi:MAG: glycosyltransferase family A protein, partial [Bacteroidales bacterium]